MKFLFDLFPVVLFFVAFKLFDIYVATAVAIGATVLQIGWLQWKRRKVDKTMWVTLVIIAVFGGATLALHDESFIKWKPTVLYWLFAAILAVGRQIFRRNLIAALMKGITLPDPVWARVTWMWVAFLLSMGAANLYVASHFSTDTWVNFKVWGAIGLFFLLAIATVASVARYLPDRP